MNAKDVSPKLMAKLRVLSEKPDGWGHIRMIEPADARAILAALPADAAQATEDWKLMPIKLTDEMSLAMAVAMIKGKCANQSANEQIRHAYRAALDTAPIAPSSTTDAGAVLTGEQVRSLKYVIARLEIANVEPECEHAKNLRALLATHAAQRVSDAEIERSECRQGEK